MQNPFLLTRTLTMRKKLNLLDSGWLTMETPQTPMHVAGLMLLKTPEDAGPDYMQSMLRWMTECKEVSAPFNRRLAGLLPMNLDAAWLTDQDVDLDYHVRHAALPKPGRVRELLALVSRIHAQHMDKNHPLWECYLIEGLEGNRFAIYFKIHHSLVDGVAGMRMVQSRLSRSPQERLPVMWSSEWDELIKKPARPVSSASVNPVKALLDNAKALGSAAVKLAQISTTPLDSNVKSIYKAPPTPINKRVSQARRFVAQSWDMDRIRKVAKEYDATINDMVLTMCGGALREYMAAYGGGLPKNSLVANIPVSIRSADAADDNGNAISALQVTLGTNIKSARSRMDAIKESTRAAKERLGAMNKLEIHAHTVLSNLPLLAGQVSGLDGRIPVLFNVVVSNVPGPQETLYMNGAELLALYPVSLIWHGYAVNITVQSYNGHMDFGIIACRESAPKVQRMLDFLESTLKEIEEESPARKSRRRNLKAVDSSQDSGTAEAA